MSTIVTENLKRSSETASRSLRGVAAAWLNFNGTGTVAIRTSHNISSITDIGTGIYSQSLTAAMSSVDYALSVTGAGSFADTTTSLGTSPTVNSQAFFAVSVGSLADNVLMTVATHGDLA